MKITEFSVKNTSISILLILMLAVLGTSTLINIPRSEDPEIESPEFPIIAIYPGASPKDMEQLVVDVVEEKISEMDDIKDIKSNIGDGVAVINVRYRDGSDPGEKYQEVVREINALKSELPQDIYSIDVKKIQASDVNIMQLSLVSENASYDKLKIYAENLKEDLEKLPQLKKVKIWGLPEKNIRVELNIEKLTQLKIPLNSIIANIMDESQNIPGGSIDIGRKTLNVQTSGNYKTIDEVKNTIVYFANGNNVYLKDIANVFFDFEKNKHITRINSNRAVIVSAAQKTGENITKLQPIYLKVIEEFKSKLPSNIDLIDQFDQAENVNKRLMGLGLDFIIAILLVSITLLPLGGRAAIIVMISIPLSLSMGVVLLDILGYNLNQLSIVGLVVALGLLVDDSIVVIENIERWLREGHSLLDAVLKGTKQISLAVLGTTATLIVAFMPLVFLPGQSGDFIRSLPMAVIVSVLSSMIVSLTFIPFLSSKFLKDKSDHNKENFFLRLLQKVIHGTYAVLLDKALKKPVLTVVITVILFVGSLFLFSVIGFSLFPASEKPQFMIDITTPLQSNLEYTDEITKQIEIELKNVKEIQYFSTNVGKGNPTVYYNVIQENERSDFAQIFVQLKQSTSPKRKLEIIEHLRNKFANYHNAIIAVKNFEQGPPVTAPIEIKISGDNLDTLRVKAATAEKLLKSINGTIYVNNPMEHLKSDLKIDIDKEKAYLSGLSTINIDRIIRLVVTGIDVGKLIDDNGEKYPILLTKKKEDINSMEAFENLYFNNNQGHTIPLKQISTIKLTSSPLTINHIDKERTVTISSFVKKGYLADDINKEVQNRIGELNLSQQYNAKLGGEVEQREESFSGFETIIMITIFFFFGILLLEFKTLKSTFIVLSVIPLGIVGAVVALLITGNTLSFVAIIGLIALAGIEVKNTILLVDFINKLREDGKNLDDAIIEAGEIRFIPIILTTLTAIGGLIPIAVSTNPLISPLAIVIIGGLISSTLLSRIVTPVVYKLLPPKI